MIRRRDRLHGVLLHAAFPLFQLGGEVEQNRLGTLRGVSRSRWLGIFFSSEKDTRTKGRSISVISL